MTLSVILYRNVRICRVKSVLEVINQDSIHFSLPVDTYDSSMFVQKGVSILFPKTFFYYLLSSRFAANYNNKLLHQHRGHHRMKVYS